MVITHLVLLGRHASVYRAIKPVGYLLALDRLQIRHAHMLLFLPQTASLVNKMLQMVSCALSMAPVHLPRPTGQGPSLKYKYRALA